MYSPTVGRFMQTDPIGYGDGMNMYAYVGNDPVNFVDPTGLDLCPVQDGPGEVEWEECSITVEADRCRGAWIGLVCVDIIDFNLGEFINLLAPLQGPTQLGGVLSDYCSGPRIGGSVGAGGTGLIGGPGLRKLLTGRDGPNGIDLGIDISITVPMNSLSRLSLIGTQISINGQIAGLSGIGAYAGGGGSVSALVSEGAMPAGFSTDEGFIAASGAGDGLGGTVSGQNSYRDNGFSYKTNVDGGVGGGAFIATGKYNSAHLATPALGC